MMRARGAAAALQSLRLVSITSAAAGQVAVGGHARCQPRCSESGCAARPPTSRRRRQSPAPAGVSRSRCRRHRHRAQSSAVVRGGGIGTNTAARTTGRPPSSPARSLHPLLLPAANGRENGREHIRSAQPRCTDAVRGAGCGLRGRGSTRKRSQRGWSAATGCWRSAASCAARPPGWWRPGRWL